MFGRSTAGVGVDAGTSYSGTTMGQETSAFERESIKLEPSIGTIVREDSIQIEEESSSDFWSIHCDRTDQAPYGDGEMMTSTSLLGLPMKNETRELAFFLKTTGPCAPHRRPSKAERPSRGTAAPKRALNFLRLRPRRSQKAILPPHDALNLRDEGGLLLEGVEQRQTASGRRYLHLVPKVVEEDEPQDEKKREILTENESPALRVSICIEDDLCSSTPFDDNWFSSIGSNCSRRIDSPEPPRKSSAHLPLGHESTVRVVDYTSPVRPRASNPPTPQPDSATTMAESYRSDLTDHPAARSSSACRALSSHPVRHETSLTALPKVALPKEEFLVKYLGAGKEVEIKHPSPRRFASHPVLLQRASSIASSLYPRSFSDSPGPPPPRSPLRLRRDPRTIESIIACSAPAGKSTPKLAPTIEPVAEYNDFNEALAAMTPTVVTDCTGPIKRPRSRGKTSTCHPAYPSSRKEREERIRSRKLRDRPNPIRTIDALVATPPPSQPLTRRLRKARPQIQIPELRPAPLVTRASSSASSNASWKKITECARTPVSPVPSQGSSPAAAGAGGEKTGYTPVSPTASQGSAHASMTLSPVMLIAEEYPVPKTKPSPKPAKLVLRDGKSYAPRPRSASIPRNVMMRRSRVGSNLATPGMQQTPSRSASPVSPVQKAVTPPLPSPPPNRALPPTPPASGSEKPARLRLSETRKTLPVPPDYEILPTPPKRVEALPHVATQAQRKSTVSKDSGSGRSTTRMDARLDARLEALEKQNKMLSAALLAALCANGVTINGPLAGLAGGLIPEESGADGEGGSGSGGSPATVKVMAWESRVARRSAASATAASHATSSSNGSALEMYMSTRRGSRHGCGGA
ncbi:hypothetical protein LTR53_014585 [Teratosphaeriaceae sp. CCFEE 6253]|nr:hypothetical protein LTR53_014585 [Teratosphaeriaceae sp. CCFEE 6253]